MDDMVSMIYGVLLHNKIGDCPIYPDEEVMLKKSIKGYLERGWMVSEILAYMKYTEYFDNVTPEEECLDAMRVIVGRVKDRLLLKA